MSKQLQRWQVFADAETLTRQAEQMVRGAAAAAIDLRGRFDLVLAGGSTPRILYQRLAAVGAGDAGWHVWFGDERCLPAGDPERNETMARQAWLDQSDIPREQIHAVPASVDPVAAAERYADLLAEVEGFDLVLLGIGEDGHTASLFPGHELGDHDDAADVLPVSDAPKPPPERVTMSASRLSKARQVLVLVTGSGKAPVVRHWRRGDADLPIEHIRPSGGVDVFLDQEALPRSSGAER